MMAWMACQEAIAPTTSAIRTTQHPIFAISRPLDLVQAGGSRHNIKSRSERFYQHHPNRFVILA
jgi:hypothetical protein